MASMMQLCSTGLTRRLAGLRLTALRVTVLRSFPTAPAAAGTVRLVQCV
jgi:hypothetical protein